MEGDRISEEDLRRQIGHQEHEEGRIVILVAEDEKGEVVGCCAVKPWKDSKVLFCLFYLYSSLFLALFSLVHYYYFMEEY